jgi:hypothetical protein
LVENRADADSSATALTLGLFAAILGALVRARARAREKNPGTKLKVHGQFEVRDTSGSLHREIRPTKLRKVPRNGTVEKFSKIQTHFSRKRPTRCKDKGVTVESGRVS